ncbi:hypothetical protein J3F83DRAFT_764230 [Trichoderma novae-zelandiae]
MSSQLESEAPFEATTLGFLRRQFTRPKPLPTDLTLAGKAAIVTGSNVGLGLSACRQLLQLGLSRLVMAVRSQAKGDAAAARLRRDFASATVSVWIVDMESYDSVRAFASRCESLERIDIVILNAGLTKSPYTVVGATGNEVTLQVNYLSTALLAILLLPILKAKKLAGASQPPVLSIVGSDAMYRSQVELQGPILPQFHREKTFTQFAWYGKTKLLQALFVSKVAEFVSPRDVVVNVSNPGMTEGTDYPKIWYTSEGKALKERLWEETMEELNFFEFLRQLSSDSSNIVIGLVRNKAATDQAVAQELAGRSNIHILQADITDYEDIKNAVAATSKITGGTLDYLIANAAYVSEFDAYDPIGVLGETPQDLEEDLLKSFKVNVVANVHLFNLYMPLVLAGTAKKVIALSTGMADLDSMNKYELHVAPGYAISKAAMNVAVGKFHAQYKKEGVLFMSIGPGVVDTGHYKNATPEQMERVGGMFQKFVLNNPDFKGPAKPEAAVKDVIAVWENASIEGGSGGSYVSHHGNKKWL